MHGLFISIRLAYFTLVLGVSLDISLLLIFLRTRDWVRESRDEVNTSREGARKNRLATRVRGFEER